MSRVTVIGTGNIGSTVASIAVKGGADVQLLGRDRDKTAAAAQQAGATAGQVGDAITGDIIVLAVPYPALAELAEQYAGQFDGKVLVDVTNPVDFATFDALTVPADSSAAAELQSRVPAAKVVKAFNTNFAATLATGQVGQHPTTVLVAGDDADAKQAVIDIVTAGGVTAVAAGSLKRARELEALGFLQLTLGAQEIVGWTGGFAIQK
ncbi:NADPH-dependent F420 reductase [Curtobacterium flaccumfaciens pv. beticola]|uniref:NADPH-dependent F420 reductase n=1 Tax=Curtobacterium flaccumfaciens TaxID=2035 RepID=UPI00349FBF82|nr:NADPH-dependent F420 reductase [Curtobacterium flaccumfaciens pv. basellae]